MINIIKFIKNYNLFYTNILKIFILFYQKNKFKF